MRPGKTALLLLLLAAPVALAQTTTSSIRGVVVDTSGPLADATIEAVRAQSGFRHTATTGPDGSFTLAGPVPENDRHGELLHLAAQVYRFTGDRELLAKVWPHIEKAVSYIEELRQQRRTAAHKNTPYFGLLPESISHEGYSDKPVHSYWDDFFALRGLKDAAGLAQGKQAEEWSRIRDEFRTDLLASIRSTLALHEIDYLPASVEKGDFDPTSTSIGIAPGGELADLPQAELRRTFERYYQEARVRKGEAYTPYELRTLRTLLRLGWRDHAHELLGSFLKDRRPAAWNHWERACATGPGGAARRDFGAMAGQGGQNPRFTGRSGPLSLKDGVLRRRKPSKAAGARFSRNLRTLNP